MCVQVIAIRYGTVICLFGQLNETAVHKHVCYVLVVTHIVLAHIVCEVSFAQLLLLMECNMRLG